MNSHRFSRQIKHEAKSHPLGAAVLGILALVAVGYWTALACSWIGNEDGKCGNSGKIKAVKETLAKEHLPANLDPKKILAAELAKTIAPPINAAKADWKQIVEWMKSDPRTLALETLPGRADAFEEPFETVEKQNEKGKKQQGENNLDVRAVIHDPTPRDLEMELSSTLLAPGGGVALINGRAYRLGRGVTSEKDQRQTKFKLAEIHNRHVVLTRKDKKYKLLLPERKTSGSISIKAK